MPAGPIGGAWAPGTWSDTAWEANTWSAAGTGSSVAGQGLSGLSGLASPWSWDDAYVWLMAIGLGAWLR